MLILKGKPIKKIKRKLRRVFISRLKLLETSEICRTQFIVRTNTHQDKLHKN